jgi:hypothetical protein
VRRNAVAIGLGIGIVIGLIAVAVGIANAAGPFPAVREREGVLADHFTPNAQAGRRANPALSHAKAGMRATLTVRP